jgi:hypothetical protein
MDAHLVRVDPETGTVTVGAAVTRTILRRLYGLATERLVATETRNGVVVSRTYTARPAPPLVVAPGWRSGEEGAAVREPHPQVTAREAHLDRAVAVGGRRDGHRARP